MTRGQLNNNPGNVDRTEIKWQGMAPVQDDPRFITFIAPEWGFRCMARIIHGHFLVDATVQSIVTRWCPPVDVFGRTREAQDTADYVKCVADRMAVGATRLLTWDIDALPLLRAIAIHENNEGPNAVCLWPDSDILNGIKLESST